MARTSKLFYYMPEDGHTMPFKLRLKKSRQYNVVSKSLFVIGIELLDRSSVECTLATDSLGRECLDNICQKLSFQQPEFFGLRYVSHCGTLRWVELERPLKRQLDKYASKYTLYLRIMHYVGVNLLTDEMTRYHYFLQLKSDVIEGRIKCNTEQAILLASYSMQAEFGNHDPEKHTPEYLKEFVLFPKHVVSSPQIDLTEAVICQHAALAGLPQGTAEEYYILAAQQLEGYGQETFSAKDTNGNEVIIGISLIGITVKKEVLHFTKFYKWKDITNVINHKRYFGIECQIPEETVHYQFPDIKSAKYVWRMCVHQHTFFIQYGQCANQGNTAEIAKSLLSRHMSNELHVDGSREELDADNKPEDSVIELNLKMTSQISNIGWDRRKAQSTSCLDLCAVHPEVDRLRALLPGYRQAPDYETAVQQKYYNQRSSAIYNSHPDIHSAAHAQQYQSNLNSLYKYCADTTHVDQHYRSEMDTVATVDEVINPYSAPKLDIVTNNLLHGMRMVHLYKPPPPYPINRPSSNSTPDLASQPFAQYNQYFINSQVSGSSPDLVSSRSHYNIPYLHYRVAEYPSDVLPNPEAHRTYTNLTTVVDSCQEINNLKANLDSVDTFFRRQNGVVFPQNTSITSYVSFNKCNGVGSISEPIYENVPLPWPHVPDKNAPNNRSRASSIQSAPEINTRSVLNDRNVSSVSDTDQNSASEKKENDNTVFNCSSMASSCKRIVTENYTSNLSTADSSQNNDTNPGNLGKNQPHKSRKKWAGLLSGKHKFTHRHNSETTEEIRSFHETLPKHPLPITISKESMCQLLERKLEDSQLVFEFEKIPRIKQNPDFTTAQLPENSARNRHKDILPYEENRVRLSPSKENKQGYINASNLTASVGNHQKFYIAAQSPLPNTVNDFWQMIWETDVYLVVSLTDFDGRNTVPYYHVSLTDKPFETGQFQVWSQFSQETGHCITTKLRLFHGSTRRVRGIWHLLYNEWVNDGCPKEVAHFLGFMEELNSVRQHVISEIPAGHNRNPPVLVHCSSGIGRTSVTVLSDLLLYTLDHNQELDIARAVSQMRHQRMFMIETVSQYRFIYSLLSYYLKNSRLI